MLEKRRIENEEFVSVSSEQLLVFLTQLNLSLAENC